MLRFLAVSIAAFSASTSVLAQQAIQPDFKPLELRRHVAFLADDLLEGRDAGTRGYDIAALYVASQFQGLGLKPGAGSSWNQNVPFVQHRLTQDPAAVTVNGVRYEQAKGALITANPVTGSSRINADAVYVGYGLDLPAHGYDDYRGLDVKGKVVVVLPGTPTGTPSDLAAHFAKSKGAMASKRGAVGMITLRPKELSDKYPIEQIAKSGGSPSLAWATASGQPYIAAPGIAFGAFLNPQGQEALFVGTVQTASQVLAEASAKGAKPRGFALKHKVALEGTAAVESLYTSANVVAVLPGSDPVLANEYVVLMAHLDGLGVDPKIKNGDAINNGAMDNATGIAALIEAARALSSDKNRPRRSILFAAVTSEEDGLLGSSYLANNPVTGDGKIVGVVNLDMPVLLYDFQDVIAFGAEHSTLGEAVRRAGEKMNIALTPDPLPEQGLFARSDHYSFVKQGIPSVFLMTGFANGGDKGFTGFLQTNYHKPSDDLKQPINWNAAAKFAKMNYLIASEIANADHAPSWYSDSSFGELFAKNSKKAGRAK